MRKKLLKNLRQSPNRIADTKPACRLLQHQGNSRWWRSLNHKKGRSNKLKYKPGGASHLCLEEGQPPPPSGNFKKSRTRSKAEQRLDSNPRLNLSAAEALTLTTTTRVAMMTIPSQLFHRARELSTTQSSPLIDHGGKSQRVHLCSSLIRTIILWTRQNDSRWTYAPQRKQSCSSQRGTGETPQRVSPEIKEKLTPLCEFHLTFPPFRPVWIKALY